MKVDGDTPCSTHGTSWLPQAARWQEALCLFQAAELHLKLRAFEPRESPRNGFYDLVVATDTGPAPDACVTKAPELHAFWDAKCLGPSERHAWASASDSNNTVTQLLFHMLLQLSAAATLRIVVRTFNAAISACVRAKASASASFRLFEEMSEISLTPDVTGFRHVISYSAAVKACETELQGIGAWKLQADLISFNSAISACGTSAAWRMAVGLLQRCWDSMAGNGWFTNAYIYLLDHYRVLRVVPASTFASMQIDWWCQVLLAPCCGLLAACLIFKGNCQGLGFCLDPSRLVLACMAAWLVHCVIHLLLLIFVVPLGDTSLPVKGQDTIRYQQVAAAEPCNWFSANPVHCLRSKHIHRDDPPSSFFTPGQESTMQINEAIGCFFSAKAAKVENASDFEIRLPAALRGRWNCALPAMTFWKKAEDGTSDPPS
eukprot:s93_g37.t2